MTREARSLRRRSYELDGDTLRIWGGERDSDATYTGTLNDDGTVLEGAWSWPGGGYRTTATRQSATDA